MHFRKKTPSTDVVRTQNFRLQYKQNWPFQSINLKRLCPRFMVCLPRFINQRKQTGKLNSSPETSAAYQNLKDDQKQFLPKAEKKRNPASHEPTCARM